MNEDIKAVYDDWLRVVERGKAGDPIYKIDPIEMKAICNWVDPDMYFDEDGGNPRKSRHERLKSWIYGIARRRKAPPVSGSKHDALFDKIVLHSVIKAWINTAKPFTRARKLSMIKEMLEGRTFGAMAEELNVNEKTLRRDWKELKNFAQKNREELGW